MKNTYLVTEIKGRELKEGEFVWISRLGWHKHEEITKEAMDDNFLVLLIIPYIELKVKSEIPINLEYYTKEQMLAYGASCWVNGSHDEETPDLPEPTTIPTSEVIVPEMSDDEIKKIFDESCWYKYGQTMDILFNRSGMPLTENIYQIVKEVFKRLRSQRQNDKCVEALKAIQAGTEIDSLGRSEILQLCKSALSTHNSNKVSR